ncbi:MAG TPA: hypothetical protein ENK43_09465 [Planctomycetes bacterium]|nr:hypothetical protein [Planctomycetota bacterium]
MSENRIGPFAVFRLLWFPFSLPAITLGATAVGLFWLTNFGLAKVAEPQGTTDQMMLLFFANLRSWVMSFSLAFPEKRGVFAIQSGVFLLLWAYLGVAMARCAAVRLSRDEYVGLGESLRFASRHFGSALLYPFVLALVVGVVFAVEGLLGLAMQIPWLGTVFYLFLPLAFGLTLLNLIVSWTGIVGLGLVSGALAVERKGTLDAWGKSLNYIFARPIHVLLSLVVMKIVLVDVLVHYLMELRMLHAWTASALCVFHAGSTFQGVLHGSQALEGIDRVDGWLWRAFSVALSMGILGWILSLLMAGMTGMFLILRHDVDGIDVADIELASTDEDPDPTPVQSPGD